MLVDDQGVDCAARLKRWSVSRWFKVFISCGARMVARDSRSLSEEFSELRDYAEDVACASEQAIEDAIRRFDSLLHGNGPLGDYVREVLPDVDFDDWHASGKATEGGMVGSARLEWPTGRAERVALQAELVRRIADGDITLWDFTYTFTYVANNINSNIAAFIEQVFTPFHRDLVRLATPLLEEEEGREAGPRISGSVPFHFIDKARHEQLEGLSSTEFDLSRLSQLCREIDFAFRNECFLAVASLTRALLDHVLPIFAASTFAEVASNYAGSKSFRDSMRHLENSARKIGDAYLHTQIRKRESLPTPTQVNFSNDVDVLLSEIVRVLS